MTNRGTTRRGVFGALAGAAAATTLTAEPAFAGGAEERPFQAKPGSSKRPNILFILADDLGWADLSSYGSPNIETPHLDRLAKAGVRFTDGYSAGAVCSPPGSRSTPVATRAARPAACPSRSAVPTSATASRPRIRRWPRC